MYLEYKRMTFVTSELVITIKPKGKETFGTSTLFLFNTLQKYYHKNMHSFPISVTIHHFRTLKHLLLASFPNHKFVFLAYCKVHPITGHEGPERGYRYSSTLSLRGCG
jgi:hypothetical protein